MGDKRLLGIDFGTTNTAAAWIDEHGEPHVVPVKDGDVTLPSVAAYHTPGQPPLVGEAAREMLAEDPRHTIHSSKRFLGRRFLSDYVGRHRGRFRWDLVEGPDGTVAADVFGQVLPLAEVAEAIFKRMLELANIAAGHTFEACVLAVPAHFNHRQRDLLRHVAAGVGLECRAVVNEPTAAAINYARGLGKLETVLVYDLGGGTFDTTLLRIDEYVTRVLATGGEAFLGGLDFDARIADALAERFEADHGLDISDDRGLMQRLMFAAERAKIALSNETSTTVEVPCVFLDGDDQIDLSYEITRDDLERWCAPIVERTLGIALATVGQANVSAKDVGEVVLVGGVTRMPLVRSRLRAHFEVSETAVDPDAAVALGAAALGAEERGLTDVLAMPILVMLPGSGPREAIEKDASLPCTREVEVPRGPAGRDLPIIVYEALELTSIERDILGTLRVPAGWLDEHPGELKLAAAMSASSELGFRMHTDQGAGLPLELETDDGKQHKKREPVARAGSSSNITREEARVPADLPVGVRAEQGGELVPLITANLSSGGVFVRSAHAPRPGSRVEVVLYAGKVPLAMHGTVSHVVTPEAAAAGGEVGGFGVAFLQAPPETQGQLDALLDSLRSGASGGAAEPTFDDVGEGADVQDVGAAAERVKQFFDHVSAGRVYEALHVEPLASTADIHASAQDLRGTLTGLQGKVSEGVRKKLDVALRVLDRTEALLCDPRRRLEHDMKHGHVLADERLGRANESGIFNAGLLRDAWRKSNAGDVDKAQIHLAYAVRAEQAGDLAGAAAAAKEALALDPFDLELRRFAFELGQKIEAKPEDG